MGEMVVAIEKRAGKSWRTPSAPANANLEPNAVVRAWLARGLKQPGGKLPLFDHDGQDIEPAIVRGALERGWAEPWFSNPNKPDWLICRLTDAGRLHARTAAEALAEPLPEASD